MCKKYGSFFDYHQAPRAQIFKRDQHKVSDLNSMLKLMRYLFGIALQLDKRDKHCEYFNHANVSITGIMTSKMTHYPNATVLHPTVGKMVFQHVQT